MLPASLKLLLVVSVLLFGTTQAFFRVNLKVDPTVELAASTFSVSFDVVFRRFVYPTDGILFSQLSNAIESLTARDEKIHVASIAEAIGVLEKLSAAAVITSSSEDATSDKQEALLEMRKMAENLKRDLSQAVQMTTETAASLLSAAFFKNVKRLESFGERTGQPIHKLTDALNRQAEKPQVLANLFISFVFALTLTASFLVIINKTSVAKFGAPISQAVLAGLAAYYTFQFQEVVDAREDPTFATAVVATALYFMALFKLAPRTSFVFAVLFFAALFGFSQIVTRDAQICADTIGQFGFCPAPKCPKPPIQLVNTCDPKVNKNCVPVPSLTQEGDAFLQSLQGPLYIIAEQGPFRSYKSTRLTLIIKALMSEYSRRVCTTCFEIRGKGGRCTNLEGCTKGIWAASIPVAHINREELNSNLRSAISGFSNEGTILLLDMEGAGDVGSKASQHANVAFLQLVLASISSHVSFVTESKLDEGFIHSFAVFGDYFKSMIDIQSASDTCMDERSSVGSSSMFLEAPPVSILLANSELYLSKINGVSSVDTQVFEVSTNASLNLKDHFFMELSSVEDPALDRSINSLIEMWGRVPVIACLPALDSEKESFREMMTNPGFGKGWNVPYGNTWGLINHNLADIFFRVQSKKYYGKEANGADIKSLIEDVILVLKIVPASYFNAVNSRQLADDSCSTLKSLLKGWEEKLNEKFAKQLPFDDGFCKPGEPNLLCSKDLFESNWDVQRNSLDRLLCLSTLLVPGHHRDQCLSDIKSQADSLKLRFWNENLAKCRFKWETPPFVGECTGDCPQHRTRTVTCLNAHGLIRPDRCCLAFVSPKPAEKETCNLYTYSWRTSAWSECPRQCSISTRRVWCQPCGAHSPPAEDSFCSNMPKPNVEMECDTHYTWIASDWGNCDCHQKTRTLSCQDCHGRPSGVQACAVGPTYNTRPAETERCSCPPPPPPPPPPPSRGGGGGCFGMKTNVKLSNTTTVMMAHITPGMRIAVPGPDTDSRAYFYDDVIYVSQHIARDELPMISISSTSGHAVTMTSNHLVYRLSDSTDEASREIVQADQIKVNDTILVLSGDDLRPSQVMELQHVNEQPVTVVTRSGVVLSDGVASSCYTTSAWLSHTAAFLLRAHYDLFGPEFMSSAYAHNGFQFYEKYVRLHHLFEFVDSSFALALTAGLALLFFTAPVVGAVKRGWLSTFTPA